MEKGIKIWVLLFALLGAGIAHAQTQLLEQSFLFIQQTNTTDKTAKIQILLDGRDVFNRFASEISAVAEPSRINFTSQEDAKEALTEEIKAGYEQLSASAFSLAERLQVNSYVVQFEQHILIESKNTTLISLSSSDNRAKIVVNGIYDSAASEFYYDHPKIYKALPVFLSVSYFKEVPAINTDEGDVVSGITATLATSNIPHGQLHWAAVAQDGKRLSKTYVLDGYNLPQLSLGVTVANDWEVRCLLGISTEELCPAMEWTGSGVGAVYPVTPSSLAGAAIAITALLKLIDADTAFINIVGDIEPVNTTLVSISDNQEVLMRPAYTKIFKRRYLAHACFYSPRYTETWQLQLPLGIVSKSYIVRKEGDDKTDNIQVSSLGMNFWGDVFNVVVRENDYAVQYRRDGAVAATDYHLYERGNYAVYEPNKTFVYFHQTISGGATIVTETPKNLMPYRFGKYPISDYWRSHKMINIPDELEDDSIDSVVTAVAIQDNEQIPPLENVILPASDNGWDPYDQFARTGENIMEQEQYPCVRNSADPTQIQIMVEGAPRSNGDRLSDGIRSTYRFVYAGRGEYRCIRVTERHKRYIRWAMEHSEGTGLPYIDGGLHRLPSEGGVC